MFKLKIESNRDGSRWITIRKNLLLFIPYKRTKFFFPKAPRFKKFYGFVNCRFRIWKGNNFERLNIKNLRVFIRLPFFYWDKHNCGWEFGLPGIYLWRTSSK